VRTVRRLQSSKQTTVPPSSVILNKTQNSFINGSNIHNNNQSISNIQQNNNLSQFSSKLILNENTNDGFKKPAKRGSTKETSSISSKILIDSSLPRSQHAQEKRKTYQPYNYYNFKKLRKPKTEYQKNVLSPNNIIKYKTECLAVINQNKEIKKLLTKLNILADDKGYEKFLDNYFFNDECFLLKLEMLILNDYNESNTLKVFSTNKGKLPFKMIKENFYRDEIKRFLLKEDYEIEYKVRKENVLNNLNKHIENLKNFDLV
jgi:hypothetical protein